MSLKLETPKNANYCATVYKIVNTIPLVNCDNLLGASIFGLQAIVSKDVKAGDVGIIFPVETQLSEKFCKENNLYRHSELNSDTSVRGYLEDNRRVRAVKFRGNVSNCLFMPLDSLKYTGINISDLKEGDEFDFLKGEEICRKYVVKTPNPRANRQPIPKQFTRVDEKYIPQHFDIDNYFKYKDLLSPETEVIVTQKLHGTSIRIANTIVKRKLSILEWIVKFLGVKVQETEFDYVFGSRKVIKDVNNPHQNHYYEVDIWSLEGKKLEGMIPQNFIVYGELVGWTPGGAPIQKDYTYDTLQGTCKLFVYRVAFVNSQGVVVDLGWDILKEFCDSLGLSYVKEIYRGKIKDFDVASLLDINFFEHGYNNVVRTEKSLVDEGICIRVDKMTPYILKAKSPKFLEHETKILDSGEIDLESQESLTDDSPLGPKDEVAVGEASAGLQ